MALTFSSAPARGARCVPRAHGCDCVKFELSGFVRAFAKGAMDQTELKRGMFLRTSLVRVLEVDSLGRAVPDSLRGLSEWIAHDFRVERVWRKPDEPAPPATVRFVNQYSSLCPRPHWQPGRSYLLFAFRFNGRLQALVDCQEEHPSELPEAQRAFVALDSLLPRR